MTDSIPTTGSAWIDQSMEPHTIGDDYVTAVRAQISAQRGLLRPDESYAGRDEFVTWCRWKADRERHHGYERTAVLLDEWADRYDVTAWN